MKQKFQFPPQKDRISRKIKVPTYGPSVTSVFKKDQAELLYVEQMIPRDGDKEHIYWSCCDFSFGERGGYAGLQHQVNTEHEGVPFVRNNICSVWDLEESKSPQSPKVVLTYAHKGLYSTHFSDEGTGLHTSHPMPWRPGIYYATVIRRWYIANEAYTRMAMFMFSYGDNKWIHYMSVAIPGADIPLTGNNCSGFLERFAGEALGYYGIYGQHFRMNKDGSWEKPLYYEATAGGDPKYWQAKLDAGVNVKLSAGAIFNNKKHVIKLKPDQFDSKPKPAKTLPVIETVSTVYNKTSRIITVSWQISARRPPQLIYNIDIRKDSLDGSIIFQENELIPEKRKTFFSGRKNRIPEYIIPRFRSLIFLIRNLKNIMINLL